ncbi:MAG: restriction endonuclease subunit S [Comamonadaceae bacterium]|nr:restriction endonuclease subunit S [Comamonadaceae bacterium]
MSELPLLWTTTTLGTICDKANMAGLPRLYNQGMVKFVRTTDITSPISWLSVPYCPQAPPDIEKYLVRPNNILISRAGSVGFSTLIEAQCLRQRYSPRTLIGSFPSEHVIPRFVAYFLRSADYWRQISDAAAGIALANVNAAKLADIEVPSPPSANKNASPISSTPYSHEWTLANTSTACPPSSSVFAKLSLAAATSGKLTEDWRAINAQLDTHTFEFADVDAFRDYVFPRSWSQAHWRYCISCRWNRQGTEAALEYVEIPYLRVANVQRGFFDLAEIKTIRVPSRGWQELLPRKW